MTVFEVSSRLIFFSVTMKKLVVEALSDVPSDRYTTFKPVKHHDMMVETCFVPFRVL